jgi:hypothetical protein
LHRLALALHLVCVEVGACGIRLVCLLLHSGVWTGLSPHPMAPNNRSIVRWKKRSWTIATLKPPGSPHPCLGKPSR